MESVCARVGCDNTFTKRKHNQIYCTSECTRLATNTRIREQYHARRRRVNGEVRYCACGTKLSRYNELEICALCISKVETDINRNIEQMYGAII